MRQSKITILNTNNVHSYIISSKYSLELPMNMNMTQILGKSTDT